MVKAFKDHKVEVVTLTPAEYDAWIKVAQQSSYAEFAKEVPDGKQLHRRGAERQVVVAPIGRRRGPAARSPRPARRSRRTRSIRSRRQAALAAVRLRRRGADRARRRRRLPHGVRALRAQPEHDLADRFRHLQPGRRDLRRQPLRADDARPRQRRRAAALPGPRASAAGSRCSRRCVSLAFCVTITVLTFQFWKEAWDNRWVSDTMWRARLWIPYSSMPIGLGILSAAVRRRPLEPRHAGASRRSASASGAASCEPDDTGR